MIFSENAIKVLEHRYLHGGETPNQLIVRVAKAIADVPFYKTQDLKLTKTSNFVRLLDDNLMWPNTPCLINAGKSIGQLAACFVIPVYDSIEDIFNAMKEAAIIQKTGGGTGFSFSRLRPKNWPVDTTQGIASGPISFMRVFNSATGEMKQGGVRRGANMAVLRIDHPDIEEFITCKDQEGDLSNFNISVSVTDEFMKSLSEETPFALRWNGKTVREVNPETLWKKIYHQAWKNGEPGLIFIDKINQDNPLREIEEIEGVNPCGEQPLPSYGICNLGSINLSSHVKPGWEDFLQEPEIDYDLLKWTVETGVEFLDNMIEINHYPLQQLKTEALLKRRIGLGIMGLADMFLKMRIAYGSEDSFRLAEKVMKFIDQTALQASIKLGKSRGVPNALQELNCEIHRTLRNGVLTTIAPTGSVSIIAGCSSGCEPVFAFDLNKSCINSSLNMKHWFIEWYESLKGIGAKLPPYAVEASDISPYEHILVQASLQKHVGSAISKTINCDQITAPDMIGKILERAYEENCKSITVYRDGSRVEQALTKTKKTEERNQDVITKFEQSRPNILEGKTIKIKTGRGKLYITVNEIEGKPFEVFLKIGKSGREDFAYSEAIGRLISLGLRAGIPVETMVRHLDNISGADQVFDYGRLIKSVPDAVAYFLKEQYLKGIENPDPDCKNDSICPDCGGIVNHESNCLLCQNCGWSKC